jgi:hypothetical protein
MTAMKINSKLKAATRQDTAQEALSVRNQRRKPSRSSTPTTEFGRNLRDLLGNTFKPGEVNEEELFAATTHQLIKNRFGDGLAKDFRSAFRLNMADKPATEKFASAERATKDSLRFFVDSTLMTRDEAKQIRDLAFATAQLDNNIDEAWDSLGTTKATTSFNNGEKLVQGRLETSGNAPVTASSRGKVKAQSYGDAGAAASRRSRGSAIKRSA